MLEKSGRIELTTDELHQYNNGVYPHKLMSQWGITSKEEFDAIMNSGQYCVIETNRDN